MPLEIITDVIASISHECLFIFAVSIVKTMLLYKIIYSAIMVTASHNPACDNGIKIGYTNTEVIP